MYDNANDASRYLAGTVCMWDGRPVYVSDVRPSRDRAREVDALVQEIPLRRAGFSEWVSINDPRFNCTKYNLGYVNTADGNVAYVSRRPARTTHQGLSSQNLNITGMSQERQGWGRRDLCTELIRSEGFDKTLKNQYPSLAEARQKLLDNPEVRAVAFDRHFAIRRHRNFRNLFFLNYKGDEISWSDTQEFSLPEGFRHLFEMCNEKGCLRAA